MSVVEELRAERSGKNDASASICVDETSDADLAQALEQNPFVTEIELDLEGVAASRLEFFAACDCDACQPRNREIAGCNSVLRKEMHPPVGSLNLASDSAEHCHSKCGVAVATSSHRYFYVCGQCVFNHIIQSL